MVPSVALGLLARPNFVLSSVHNQRVVVLFWWDAMSTQYKEPAESMGAQPKVSLLCWSHAQVRESDSLVASSAIIEQVATDRHRYHITTLPRPRRLAPPWSIFCS